MKYVFADVTALLLLAVPRDCLNGRFQDITLMTSLYFCKLVLYNCLADAVGGRSITSGKIRYRPVAGCSHCVC